MWNYIITFLVGATVPIFISWLQRRDEQKRFKLKRKDKYKFVAIERRLEAHQQAMKYWNQLRLVIHEKDIVTKTKSINDATNFWYDNCLYLEKETRENFYKVIFLVSNYEIYLEAWKYANKGPEKEKTHKDLIKTWAEIHALSSIIMREVELEPISMKEEKDAAGENIK